MPRPGHALPAAVAVLGLTALTAGQLTINRAGIEHDLQERSLGTLHSAGFTGVGVSVSGRDITLTGPVASAAKAAEAVRLAGGAEGVRVATSRLAVSGSTAAPAATPSPTPAPSAGPEREPDVTATLADRTVTLTGTVPSQEARQSLMAAAAGGFGPDGVRDQLAVDPAVDDAGLRAVSAAVAELRPGADGAVALSGGMLTMRGTLGSASERDAAAAAARDAAGDAVRVVDDTADPQPPRPGRQQIGRQLADLPKIEFISTLIGLSGQGRETVRRAAQILQRNPDLRVRVDGHTDSFGTEQVNQDLSRARAIVVRDALVGEGVSARRLSVIGFGESRLLLDDRTAADGAVNRRVVLTVLDPPE